MQDRRIRGIHRSSVDLDEATTSRLTVLGAEVGSSWARSRRDALEDEGRHITDGWPGTMSEARTRVVEALAGAGAVHRLDASEFAAVVQSTYTTARATWRSWTTR
jgi:hypothetical protein